MSSPTNFYNNSGRVRRELLEFDSNGEDIDNGLKIEVINDNLTTLRGYINGPTDTAYATGRFEVAINIPERYPFVPPEVKFITKIWHPNISSVTGIICVDFLREHWAAAITQRVLLLSLQCLLSSPEPTNPQDAVVARQYLYSSEAFHKTAAHWTNAYAGGTQVIVEYDLMLKKYMDLTQTDVDKARCNLSNSDWDLDAALRADL